MLQRELPRLRRYLAGLPEGLLAHPACVAKGGLVRNLLDGQPLAEMLPHLPEPLRRLAADPPVGSEWIPEVQFGALLLAVADLRGLDDRALHTWTRARNRALFLGPAYRYLMEVHSPASLLRAAGPRWATFHRGSTLEVEGIEDRGVGVALRFPAGLFGPALVRVYAEALAAALEVANAAEPLVEVVEERADLARYRARWR